MEDHWAFLRERLELSATLSREIALAWKWKQILRPSDGWKPVSKHEGLTHLYTVPDHAFGTAPGHFISGHGCNRVVMRIEPSPRGNLYVVLVNAAIVHPLATMLSRGRLVAVKVEDMRANRLGTAPKGTFEHFLHQLMQEVNERAELTGPSPGAVVPHKAFATMRFR
jgi:hypothetical protein